MSRRRKREEPKPQAEKSKALRDILAKARVLAGDALDEASALEVINGQAEAWGQKGAVDAPYDPESLLAYIELTPHLTPCIDAYCQNIEGYGFHAEPLEPWMRDLDSEKATDAIRSAINIERFVDEEESQLSTSKARCRKAGEPDDELAEESVPEPGDRAEDGVTDAEVNERREEIRARLQREGYLFDAWFKNACSESSFVELRRKMRSDYESHGWGCVEFIRDGRGRLKRLAYVAAYTVRPLVDEGDAVEVTEDDSVTPLSEGREIKVQRRFRRYVQQVGADYVYFKSPGDPRLVSRRSGKIYLDNQEKGISAEKLMEREEPGSSEAHELLYIHQHSPRTPCPPPRWVGNLLAVLGVRASDEMNFNYFENRSIPPAIIFVSGGTIPKLQRERLEAQISQEIKGVANAHKVMVIEVAHAGARAPGDKIQTAQIDYKQLTEQHTDASFREYDVRSADRIGASFRLSPVLRGLTPSTLNRATAEAALYHAEQQVFQPERENIDWIINRVIMPEIGIRYLEFVSDSPPTTVPESLLQLISSAGPQGGLSPNDVRDIAGMIMNRPLAAIEEDWAKQPLQLTLAGAGGSSPEPQDPELTARLRAIETKVTAIVGESLRASGYEAEILARFVDMDDA